MEQLNELEESVLVGIVRCQAIIRGRRVRKLLRCKVVLQHISTIAEVHKLAKQFHQDVLANNVDKGDMEFHRALCHQVRFSQYLFNIDFSLDELCAPCFTNTILQSPARI